VILRSSLARVLICYPWSQMATYWCNYSALSSSCTTRIKQVSLQISERRFRKKRICWNSSKRQKIVMELRSMPKERVRKPVKLQRRLKLRSSSFLVQTLVVGYSLTSQETSTRQSFSRTCSQATS